MSNKAATGDQRPVKKARFACERCRSRKQKCDSDGYVCTNCERSNLKCVITEFRAREYTRMLEEELSDLRAQLGHNRSGQQNSGQTMPGQHNAAQNTPGQQNPAQNTPGQNTPGQAGNGQSLGRMTLPPLQRMTMSQAPTPASTVHMPYQSSLPMPSATSSSPSSTSVDHSLVTSAAYVSLGGHQTDPYYLGSSSGINLADIVQRTAWKQGVDLPISAGAASIESGPGRRPLVYANPNANVLIPAEMGDRLVHSFVTRVHSRFPVLEMVQIEGLRQNAAQLLSPRPDGSGFRSRPETLDRFLLLLIYAVGLLHAQLIDKDFLKMLEPELFYTTAMVDLATVLEKSDLNSIQCSVLVILYLLRCPAGPGIWHVAGSALRMCVELGLHRKEPFPLSTETVRPTIMRRRVFWFTYSLERLICQSFGRPFTLSEADIDVDLPFDLDHDNADDTQLLQLVETRASGPVEPCSLSFALHFLKLRRLDSQMQAVVYRVDQVLPPVESLASYLEAIDQWKVNSPPGLSPVQQGHIDLMHNKSIRYLLVPYLSVLDRTNPYIYKCLRSSGNICRISKRLHQDSSYAHSFVSLQTVFMCGLTLIYGLLSGKLDWDHQSLEDLQACSTVMFVVAERNPQMRKYRDVYESLMKKTTEWKFGQSESRDDSDWTESIRSLWTEARDANYWPESVDIPDFDNWFWTRTEGFDLAKF